MSNETKNRVILYPNREAANAAKMNSSSLGVEHTTLDDLLQSLWDLWGDFRQIVSSRYRSLFVMNLLSEFDLLDTLGTAQIICDLIYKGSGHKDIMQDIATGKGWKAKICSLALRYLDDIKNHGYVEEAEALSIISPYLDNFDITLSHNCFLEEPYAGSLGVKNQLKAPALRATMDKSFFLFPSGPEILPHMIAERASSLAETFADSSICIYTDDADRILDCLVMRLDSFKGGIGIEKSVSITETNVGRFIVNCMRLLQSKTPLSASDDLVCAVDIALSPVSCIKDFNAKELPSQFWRERGLKASAVDLDALWRGNRLLQAKDFSADLSLVSTTFECIKDLLNSYENCGLDDFDRASGRVNKEFTSLIRSLNESDVEAKALSSIMEIFDISKEIGLGAESLLKNIENITLNVGKLITSGQGELDTCDKNLKGLTPTIMIASLMGASRMGCGAFDHVIIADVSDEAFNSKQKSDPTQSLKDELGLMRDRDAGLVSVTAFNDAIRSATNTITYVLCLHDAQSNETFPSAPYIDLIETIFSGEVDTSKLANPKFKYLGYTSDNTNKIEEFLQNSRKFQGEESLVSGIGDMAFPSIAKNNVPKAFRAFLRDDSLQNHLNKIASKVGDAIVLTPSSIEAYLQCPYSWFVERILKVGGLGEGFGPLERGNFAHHVLECFYREFDERYGRRRPAGEDRKIAENLISEIFDRELAFQGELPPSESRYIPIGAIERAEAARLKDGLQKAIIDQMAFPETYKPIHLEYQINPFSNEDDANIRYAGFAINGRIDRIDSDGKNFYILDYKGSLANHDAGTSVIGIDQLPHYVQTLIYAQAYLQTSLMSECSGALYTSYLPKPGDPIVVGSWSSSAAVFSEISNAKSRVDISFKDFLNDIEAECKKRLDGIYDSKIPNISYDGSKCVYCMFSSRRGCSL